jgi:hypothetical protein
VVDLPGRGEAARKPELALRSEIEAAPFLAPVVEKLEIEKGVLFTRSEAQALERLVSFLARRANAQVKLSHVLRALVILLLNAEGDLDARAGELGPLVRPPNGDSKGIQRFERHLARIIAAALRDSPPLRDV